MPTRKLLSVIVAALLATFAFQHLLLAAKQSTLEKVDVFVAGTDGYHTYRIPSLITTKSGALLAICEGRKTGGGDHGDLDLVMKRSDDGGRTWSPLQLIHEEGGEAKITIGNPCPVVDEASGIIWLPFTRDNLSVHMTHSSDDGKTWSKPVDITSTTKDPSWVWVATGPGVGIQIKHGVHKGRMVIPSDYRTTKRDAFNSTGFSYSIYSDDHGQTWQRGEAAGPGMNECQVVELSGKYTGQLMLNMRSYRGKATRGIATSGDGGVTWSPAVDDKTLVEPVCQASLIRQSWPTAASRGRLVFSNPADPKQRHQLTVRVSEDDGQSWKASRVLEPGLAAYSCLTTLPDGTIGCLYETGEKNAYGKLVFAHFPIEWISATEE